MTDQFVKQYQKAVKLVQKGTFQDALAILDDLATQDYEHSKLYRAYANLRLGDEVECESLLLELIEDRGSPNAAFYLADAFRRRADYDRAAEYYLLAAEKGYWAANYHIGMLLSLGKVSEEFIKTNETRPSLSYFEEGARRGHIFSKKKLLQQRHADGRLSYLSYRFRVLMLLPQLLWIMAISRGSDLRVIG